MQNYTYVGAEPESLTCTICHSIVRTHCACPSCKNAFCRECVKKWIATQERSQAHQGGAAEGGATCPCCRRTLRLSKLTHDAAAQASDAGRGQQGKGRMGGRGGLEGGKSEELPGACYPGQLHLIPVPYGTCATEAVLSVFVSAQAHTPCPSAAPAPPPHICLQAQADALPVRCPSAASPPLPPG